MGHCTHRVDNAYNSLYSFDAYENILYSFATYDSILDMKPSAYAMIRIKQQTYKPLRLLAAAQGTSMLEVLDALVTQAGTLPKDFQHACVLLRQVVREVEQPGTSERPALQWLPIIIENIQAFLAKHPPEERT